jgi:AraC-like DNA-binding protein
METVGDLAWQTVSEAVLRLQLDLDRAWTLDQIAQEAGYAPQHFATLFQKVVGEPPLKYLRSLRLERAAVALVEHEGRSVTEIAIEAGYASNEAFSRAFRRATGEAPQAFRTRARDELAEYAEPRQRARASMQDAPPGLGPPPTIGTLGPLFGWTCETTLEPQDVMRAIGALCAALPPTGPWQLGGLAQPWGWVGGPRAREFRCVRFIDGPRGPAPPPLHTWRLPATWYFTFDYEGPVDGIAAACGWIAGSFIPRSGLRPGFGPVISRIEELRPGPVRARLHAPPRELGPVFAASFAAGS